MRSQRVAGRPTPEGFRPAPPVDLGGATTARAGREAVRRVVGQLARPGAGRRPRRRTRCRSRRECAAAARAGGAAGRRAPAPRRSAATRPGRCPSAVSRVWGSVRENTGISGPAANVRASSSRHRAGEEVALGGVGVELADDRHLRRRLHLSTMADIPSEWAMWMTVSTTRRLMPWFGSSPATKEPSILTVLMACRLNGSNDDQLVPTSSTASCTPMSRRPAGRRRPSRRPPRPR